MVGMRAVMLRTFPESILEPARHVFQVPHTTSSSRFPAYGLSAPVVCWHTDTRHGQASATRAICMRADYPAITLQQAQLMSGHIALFLLGLASSSLSPALQAALAPPSYIRVGSDSHFRTRAAGYAHDAHRLFWMWNARRPHRRHSVWVLFRRLPAPHSTAGHPTDAPRHPLLPHSCMPGRGAPILCPRKPGTAATSDHKKHAASVCAVMAKEGGPAAGAAGARAGGRRGEGGAHRRSRFPCRPCPWLPGGGAVRRRGRRDAAAATSGRRPAPRRPGGRAVCWSVLHVPRPRRLGFPGPRSRAAGVLPPGLGSVLRRDVSLCLCCVVMHND